MQYLALITIYQRTFGDPPSHVHTTNNSVCLVVPPHTSALQTAAYIWWSPHVRLHYKQYCMVDGPPHTFVLQIAAYIRTNDKSIRLSVRQSEGLKCLFCVLSDPKPKLTLLTKLLMPSQLFGSLQLHSPILIIISSSKFGFSNKQDPPNGDGLKNN